MGYMINPSLHFNKLFREQTERCLSATFNEKTMETMKGCMKKKNTCVMELIMSYEINEVKPKKVYRVLSCVLYSIIENYVCIDYLSCQSKTLSTIYSNRIFKQTSFNILLGIGIPELLLNLVPCHGFMEKQMQSSY